MFFHCTKPGSSWILELICSDLSRSSGACHRSSQIKAILEEGGYSLEPIDPPKRPERWKLAGSGLKAGLCDGFHRPLSLDSIRTAGSRRNLVKELHHRYPMIKGFIFEGTGFGALTMLGWCHRHQLRSVLIPANIESLANYPDSWTHKNLSVAERFRHEQPWLRLATAIHTISIEEAWWLELHGISAQHLPYYPSGEHLKGLQTLRSERQPDPDFGYLLVADFGNAANLLGTRLLVEKLANGLVVRYPIHVVGRQIEKAKAILDTISASPFIFQGECSDSELASFQRQCLALVLCHPATSGMLTRVVDAAIANIPIMGNWMALKSYHHFFSDPIISLAGFPTHSAVRCCPERPVQAEEFLLQTLDS
jgi:hypothetical protein